MNVLNRKAFKNKFYEDIEKGIKEKFGEIYDKEIIVRYDYSMEKYSFKVYIPGTTISSSQQFFGQKVDNLLFIDSFLNSVAIGLFATKYTMEDFEKEYNDYSADNHQTLKDEITKLIDEYTKAGIVFNRVKIDEYSYFVEVYHPSYSKKYRRSFGGGEEWKTDYAAHSFSITPISTATMKNAINDVKKMLKRFNAKCVQAALTGEKI